MGSLKLKTSFPIILGDLSFQNQWLRKMVGVSLFGTVIALLLVLAAANRKPLIVTMDTQANVIQPADDPTIESRAEKMVRRYLEFRYAWQPTNLPAQLSFAKNFVAAQSVKAFEKTASDLAAFSNGKGVSQRIYPISISVVAKDHHVEVTADRFTEIQGLKAATVLRVNLLYEVGTRTLENPWGVYIVKEEEVQ